MDENYIAATFIYWLVGISVTSHFTTIVVRTLALVVDVQRFKFSYF